MDVQYRLEEAFPQRDKTPLHPKRTDTFKEDCERDKRIPGRDPMLQRHKLRKLPKQSKPLPKRRRTETLRVL